MFFKMIKILWIVGSKPAAVQVCVLMKEGESK